MDNSLEILSHAVARALGDKVAARNTILLEREGIDREAWQQLLRVGVAGPEAGAMGLEEQAVVLRAIGFSGALVPYAESEVVGRWLATGAGLGGGDGREVLTVVVVEPAAVTRASSGTSVTFRLGGARIPWGRHADRILFSFPLGDRNFLAAVPAKSVPLRSGRNMAGEPHDIVTAEAIRADALEVGPEYGPEPIRARGALCRVFQMVGAMARVNELTLQYARDRKQFNRSLSQFQIIQSYLAAMTGELCAASAMAEVALMDVRGKGIEGIAAAKIRAGQAARVFTSLGHQVHGAIGFTQEYPMNLYTRRLWAWREEYGNESQWARLLGGAIVARGADAIWPTLTENIGG